MARIVRHRPARDQLEAARFALETETGLQAVHARVCAECARAGEHLDRRCDAGWACAKREHKARVRLERLQAAADMWDRQGTLW